MQKHGGGLGWWCVVALLALGACKERGPEDLKKESAGPVAEVSPAGAGKEPGKADEPANGDAQAVAGEAATDEVEAPVDDDEADMVVRDDGQWDVRAIPPRSTDKLPLQLEAFQSAICPFPEKISPAGSVHARATGHQTACAEQTFAYQRLMGMESDPWNDWWRLDGFFERWARAHCDVYEEKNWIHIRTREWSDGTAWGLRTEQCIQRLLIERVFFLEARKRGVDAFWKLADGRQVAGRKVREELVGLRNETSQRPMPKEELGSIQPDRWREFVHKLDVVLERPKILAQQHCPFIKGAGDGCVERLELYLFSMGLDGDELRSAGR